MTVTNVMMDKLEAGELAIGIGLRQARTVDIGKAMKAAGFDWLFIDMEHNTMDLDTAVQISVAAQSAGIAPIVRVPGFQHFHASRALDGGAQGIVVPHVDTIETAREMVANCKYPPLGHRSVQGAQPVLGFETRPVAEATAAVNAATALVVMLETPEAIANADGIAAVPGIDALLIGTNDLCMEMGIPGEIGHPDVVEAYRTVVAACAAHGKHAGMGGVYDPPLMRTYIGMGARLVLGGNDLSLLMAAGRERVAALRAAQ
ncbi:MAG: aldolase/citrate lyase family protein [Alphaproteobacteria bacterium]|nr:aldolase/citrate lyase family protein [Alphaproteobacteria bacterium]